MPFHYPPPVDKVGSSYPPITLDTCYLRSTIHTVHFDVWFAVGSVRLIGRRQLLQTRGRVTSVQKTNLGYSECIFYLVVGKRQHYELVYSKRLLYVIGFLRSSATTS